ncbi:MAG: CoA transferase, partial [Actinomycetota bacterium]|nr:CoA transferase [Actinomycetota bacterium]
MTTPLTGLRVVDASTLFAGPMAAMHLGDMGAEVIKVEHPTKPDPARGHGPSKDGQNLWWKTLGRNKRTVALDLHADAGRDAFLRLAQTADVVIENFRPGTLERWGLGYEELSAANPGLVLARVTGFGQIGPYRSRPGFGTLAEAMSGFAASTGEPDGPPTLPPFGLADGIASLATAYAILVALHARAANGGAGQVVDVAIIEPILAMLGPQITRWDQLGTVQPRTGNRSTNNAPRNAYRTADGSWVAVSTSAQSIAERVVALVGRPELADEPWFATGAGRAEHADLLDEAVGGWIARHSRAQVI